jgi:hypothetical protein
MPRLDRSLACSVAVLAAATLVTACGGGSDKAAAPPASQAAATQPAATAVADGDFGVPECDQYVRKYLACIDSKVPDAARAMVRQGLDQSRAQWKQAAATPEGRAGLANACAQAESASKTAMAAYGCQW